MKGPVVFLCVIIFGSLHFVKNEPAKAAPVKTTAAGKATSKPDLKKPTAAVKPAGKSRKVSAPDPNKPCKASDLKYVYTPCDDQGNRWRVQVPKFPCKVTKPEAPMQGMKCSFSCKPGEFLDMSQQKCLQCKSGTYAVGDGKRFSDWVGELPDGFETTGYDGNSPSMPVKTNPKDSCRNAVWKLKKDYLESNGSSCRSVLTYQLNDLDREGNITFTVKSGDESSLFHVWVDNDITCAHEYDESSSDQLNRYFAVNNEWKTYTMPLRRGPNKVFFVAANFENGYNAFDSGSPTSGSQSSFDSNNEKSTLIKEIVVRGFSSSYQCDKCQAGTYSPPGSSRCMSCPENTYSGEGAGKCVQCGSEQYSMMGATKCEKRVACSEYDYTMVWEQCAKGKTRKIFKWKQPQTCSTTLKGAVKLPKPSKPLDCPSCNPGQTNNGTQCVFCPPQHYSNGKEGCKKCPPRTRDAPGLFYKFWTRFPGEPVHLYCVARPSTGCKTPKGWQVHGDYMDTGLGHSDDAELLLVITVPEFTSIQNELNMDFAVDCPLDTCRFKIEMMESDSSLHTIRTYEGHQARTNFNFKRHTSKAVRYRLVFEKKYLADKQTFKYSDARLKIYSLFITNAKRGGTEKCETCESSVGKSCVTCKPGQYIGAMSCLPCPRDTYSVGSEKGIASCKKCPEGTVSEPGSTFCHSDCLVKGTGDRSYNFTALSGLHVINGGKRFTTKGYMYYHQFKLHLCGDKVTESVCVNNATNQKGKFAKSAICRSTIIPDQNVIVSAQSIEIGKVLERIDSTAIRAKVDNTSSISRSQTDEIKFIFHSDRVTEVCKLGTYGIIRLVCDPYQDGKGKIELGDGKSCHTETCDGCNFTFTIRSKYACAQCVESDYEVIRTACNKGLKRVHYIWKQPHVCVDNGIKPVDEESYCTIFEKSILDFKVIILAFLLGGVVLALVVLYLCYRNRRLTYNYHRLIDASQTKDGELPASEMCALEEGEDEDEEVVIKKAKGGALMDRLRGIGKKNKRDFSEFETINLDGMPYSEDDDDDDDEI